MTPREGEDVKLTCSSTANPYIDDRDYQWNWIFNGSYYSTGREVLLSNVTSSISGLYTCDALHITGTKSTSGLLNVFCTSPLFLPVLSLLLD